MNALKIDDWAWFKTNYISQIRCSNLRKFAPVTSLDVMVESELYMLISYLNVTLNFQVQHEYHETVDSALTWLLSHTPEQLNTSPLIPN